MSRDWSLGIRMLHEGATLRSIGHAYGGLSPSTVAEALTLRGEWGATSQEKLRRQATLPKLFWKYVRKGPHCWAWVGDTAPRGYGRVWNRGGNPTRFAAHRLSYMLHYGDIPDGLCVLHACDNPNCVRPDHLHLGTNMDNSREAMSRGRLSRGTDRPAAKLTDAVVKAMRVSYSEGLRVCDLARRYGVTWHTAERAIHGVHWGHVL